MYDLHSHLLPGVDDGAVDLGVSLAMARLYAEQGVACVACTPHILPGLYGNSGPQIKSAVAALQSKLDEAGITLKLTSGADNHIVPDFIDGLKRGHLLTLGETAYVLVEPPHHVAPVHMEDLYFSLLVAGYVPILTHPERLSWIETKVEIIERLVARGVWMQLTCGSLRGRFGRRSQYWAERLLSEGLVHILATDAHDMEKRRPDLAEGFREAEKRVGAVEAQHLVVTRPGAVLLNKPPKDMPMLSGGEAAEELCSGYPVQTFSAGAGGGLTRRLRRFLG